MGMYGQKYSPLQSNVRRQVFLLLFTHIISLSNPIPDPPVGKRRDRQRERKKRHQICSPTYGLSPFFGLPPLVLHFSLKGFLYPDFYDERRRSRLSPISVPEKGRKFLFCFFPLFWNRKKRLFEYYLKWNSFQIVMQSKKVQLLPYSDFGQLKEAFSLKKCLSPNLFFKKTPSPLKCLVESRISPVSTGVDPIFLQLVCVGNWVWSWSLNWLRHGSIPEAERRTLL